MVILQFSDLLGVGLVPMANWPVPAFQTFLFFTSFRSKWTSSFGLWTGWQDVLFYIRLITSTDCSSWNIHLRLPLDWKQRCHHRGTWQMSLLPPWDLLFSFDANEIFFIHLSIHCFGDTFNPWARLPNVFILSAGVADGFKVACYATGLPRLPNTFNTAGLPLCRQPVSRHSQLPWYHYHIDHRHLRNHPILVLVVIHPQPCGASLFLFV